MKPCRPRMKVGIGLPHDVLERWLDLEYREPNENVLFGTSHDRQHSARYLARLCGINYAVWMRYRQANHIPFVRADEIAIRLNVHPLWIWGDAYWTHIDHDPVLETAS